MKGLHGMSSLLQIPKPTPGFNYYDKLSTRRDVNVHAYSITTRAPGGKAALSPWGGALASLGQLIGFRPGNAVHHGTEHVSLCVWAATALRATRFPTSAWTENHLDIATLQQMQAPQLSTLFAHPHSPSWFISKDSNPGGSQTTSKQTGFGTWLAHTMSHSNFPGQKSFCPTS